MSTFEQRSAIKLSFKVLHSVRIFWCLQGRHVSPVENTSIVKYRLSQCTPKQIMKTYLGFADLNGKLTLYLITHPNNHKNLHTI